MQPLEMFEAVPGSGCMNRFEELYLKARRLRNNGGPGSLREMKQAAVAQALRDGRYFRYGTSTGHGVDDPMDAADPNPNVGQATLHQAPVGYHRNQPRTATTRMHQTHPYSRTANLPSASGQTRPHVHASSGAVPASESRDTAIDEEVPWGSQGESVASLRRRGMNSDEIYDELLARPKERLRPAVRSQVCFVRRLAC